MEGIPVSGPLLCEKATQLAKKMNIKNFVASSGWRWRFCRRHGIRNLSLQGEKLSADTEAAKEFVPSFNKYIKEKSLSLDQIFNADETGLCFRLLPDKTLAGAFEKSASNRKKSKDRITLNACANASGTIKLPLQVIGKAKRPRCFKGINMDLLPVKYSSQKNAWMDASIFHKWFHDTFIPFVRERLSSLGLEQKAVLVIDNCSAHPEASQLVSDDGKIEAVFLPPNVTSLIQPMDQGVLQALKWNYKKKLIRRLVIEDDRGESVLDFLKSIDMKRVIQFISEAWDEVKKDTFRKSWRKIIPLTNPRPQPDSLAKSLSTDSDSTTTVLAELFEMAQSDELPQMSDELPQTQPELVHVRGQAEYSYAMWKGIRIRPQLTPKPQDPLPGTVAPISQFQTLFSSLGCNLEEEKIFEWLDSDKNDPGVQMFTDDEICEFVNTDEIDDGLESEEEEAMEEGNPTCPVSNSAAAVMFEQCLTWLEYQVEANAYNTTLLRELHNLAATKRMDLLKQMNISSFFKKE